MANMLGYLADLGAHRLLVCFYGIKLGGGQIG